MNLRSSANNSVSSLSPNPRPRQRPRPEEEVPQQDAQENEHPAPGPAAEQPNDVPAPDPVPQPQPLDLAQAIQGLMLFNQQQAEMQRQQAERHAVLQQQRAEQQAMLMHQQLEQQAVMQRQQMQEFVQHMLLHTGQRPKRGDPPRFSGTEKDDVELWIFNTEEYYADQEVLRQANDTRFVHMIFANLGEAAQTWYRELKLTMGDAPITWNIFKERLRERFRVSDFQYKLLGKLFKLTNHNATQEYTNKFLHLISQLDEEMPDYIKRWFYQQGLKSETNDFINQHVPRTFADVMELAIRFEGSKETNQQSQNRHKAKNLNPNKYKSNKQDVKKEDEKPAANKTIVCSYCHKPGHYANQCRSRQSQENQPKN
jgi:hypothetical protein